MLKLISRRKDLLERTHLFRALGTLFEKQISALQETDAYWHAEETYKPPPEPFYKLSGLVRSCSHSEAGPSGVASLCAFGAAVTTVFGVSSEAYCEPAVRSCNSRTSASKRAAHAVLHGASFHLANDYRLQTRSLASAEVRQPSLQGSGHSAEQAVQSVWTEIVDDIQRDDARLPPGIEVTELIPPEAHKTARGVSIRIPVREGVDLQSIQEALMSLRFARGPTVGGADEYRRSVFSSSSIAWREDGNGRRMVINQREAAREIHFMIPNPYRRTAPYVELHKTGGLEPDDLKVCAEIMAHANRLGARPAHSHRGFSGSRDMFPDRGLSGGGLFEGFAGLGGMARLLDELSNAEEFRDLASAMDDLVNDQTRRKRWGEEEAVEGGSPGALTRWPNENEAYPQVSEADRKQAELQAQSQNLMKLGARVYLPADNEQMDWSLMAGYEDQKALIEEILLIGLRNPEVYRDLAARTRKDKKAHRPKAVLFEGPPGTGKTTSARIIAKQAAVPLVYIPLEAIASKWYGESEQKLSQMLSASEAMGGCIIFLDEVDSLATSRGDSMYEATRRLLGVLLRFIDGFEAKNSIVVAATNRMQDLDSALISRFDSIINFGLPDRHTRSSILRHYAAHLSDKELMSLAEETPGMSARDLRAICEITERRWAAAIVQKKVDADSLPPLDSYLVAARARRLSVVQDKTALAPM